MSEFIVSHLRIYYTDKERRKLNSERKTSTGGVMECEADWPICLTNILKNNYYAKSPSFYIYQQNSILNNFKSNHFLGDNKLANKKIRDTGSVRTSTGVEPILRSSNLSSQIGNDHNFSQQVLEASSQQHESEDNLLIERSRHLCKHNTTWKIKVEREQLRKQIALQIGLLEENLTNPHFGSILQRDRSKSKQKQPQQTDKDKFKLVDHVKPDKPKIQVTGPDSRRSN